MLTGLRRPVRGAAGLALAVALLSACGSPPAPVAGPPEPGVGPGAPATRATRSTPTPAPSPTARATPTARPTPTARTAPPARPSAAPPSWVGDRRDVVAFAPLDDPTDVTVEGRVTDAEAWSTSKVLVVAAFLDTVVDGDPDRLTAAQRRLVERALTRSDGVAAAALRAQLPGRPGRAMTAVLRAAGDRTTTAPDRYEGLMSWSAREQVRFMAALAAGEVVSPAASAYLLAQMRPVAAQAWGLGTVGASAYKGGWLRADRVTRQMGLLDGYAVAVLTDAVGPAVVQSDGDAAHVRQLDRLAAGLRERLAAERAER
ncbi:Beta-lactamase enzyme family protein [Friedmanniella luteola]|uniref:Beta-lactamase enzyme family protein n=1 Tax=Friedmanniella luteola TaxID=546871 RepID=A0A1H1SQB0_9ACTN|nr:serine hydrolase [Friedmanniella luteola]SDS50101.1 Beta-lactamase enzyme family protein [Friedmanniella luteola]